MRTSAQKQSNLWSARYRAGESVVEICADSACPGVRSTPWIKPYTVTHNRLRSCCQPAGVYQNETETSKVRAED